MKYNFLLIARIFLIALLVVAPTIIFCAWQGSRSLVGDDDEIISLPGLPSTHTSPQFAGYASVSETPCADLTCTNQSGLFYWFVGADDYAKRPTILWTNGGPGSTSFWGFFTENGPFSVDKQGNLTPRPMAWNNYANYLIFDHPLGVGLSFAANENLPSNVGQGTNQLYAALQHFLSKHPELKKQPILLAGESYGGTYVPLLAKAILDGNAKQPEDQRIQLAGIVIVAGWVDPMTQVAMGPTYALTHGLISESEKAKLEEIYVRCQAAFAAASPSSAEAHEICGSIKPKIGEISGRYLYNIAQLGDPSTGGFTAYLNRADVRSAIHAKPNGVYSTYSEALGNAYIPGQLDSVLPIVESLLARGVRVMVVSGINDAADVNFLGTRNWLQKVQGSQGERYRQGTRTQWKDAGTNEVLGYVQKGDALSSVEVLNAGHLVPADQPRLIELIQGMMLP